MQTVDELRNNKVLQKLTDNLLPTERPYPFTFLEPDTLVSTDGESMFMRSLNPFGHVITIAVKSDQAHHIGRYYDLIWGQGGITELLSAEVAGHG